MNFPPSIVLARSLWVLAYRRAWQTDVSPQFCHPASRSLSGLFPTSREYYRIIDRISAGEKP